MHKTNKRTRPLNRKKTMNRAENSLKSQENGAIIHFTHQIIKKSNAKICTVVEKAVPLQTQLRNNIAEWSSW